MVGPFRICFRTICSTSILPNKMHSFAKQAEMLNRMLQKGVSKKKTGFSALLSKTTLSSAYENINNSRRMTALNKIYMEALIPMLTGGRYGSHFSDLGIEVSKVQVTSDLNYLNIYWITRKPSTPAALLDSVLRDALAELQAQMGSLRFCSKIPFLRFVKDARLEREIELEKIFEIADYGEDYKPLYARKVFTQTCVSGTESLPKMRENVLGLNHAEIKGRIMASIFRLKAINTEKVESESEDISKHETPEKLIPFSKKDFFKFYKRRRIMALKRLKRGEYDV